MSDNQKRWKDPEGRFDWKKPIALRWGEWDEWRDEVKDRYPIRYFCYESIPDLWDDIWHYGIAKFFKNIKWAILHRFHPRHQYNIVRTRLKPGYYDPDTQMFEAVFGLLCDYVENNIKWDVINWEGDEPRAKAWKEMNELVHWYKEVYPNRYKEFEKARPEPPISMKRYNSDKYKNEPDVVAYREYIHLLIKKEGEWAQEDEDQLIRVIKLRPFLWYA